MASSGNFCTWNALTGIKDDGSSGITFANGNTSASMTHNGISCLGTHGIKSGKWYYEINYHADGNYSDGRLFAGWTSDLKGIKYAFFKQAGGSPDREGFGVHVWFYRNGSQGGKISYQSGTDFTGNTGASNTNIKATQANDIIMCAIDADNHKMYWGINGNWGSTNTNGATATNSDITQVDGWSIESTWQGSTWQPAIWFAGASSGTTAIINAGQDSSFAGTKTSGSANASDSNSVGNFYYTPPTNFLALSSSNLVISDDIDPAQTDDSYPAKNFNVVPYTGNQTDGRAVTGVGFSPDLVWIKQRVSFSNPNILTDTVRGATKRIESNVDIAEATDSDGLQSFTSDGFTLGTNDKYNWTSSHTYVAWCWKAGGAPTATNSAGAGATPTSGSVKIDGSNLGSALAGSIPATKLSANTKGGFSIITYSGTGSNATIAHGLSAKPDFILTKRLNSSQTWGVYHTSLGATKYLALNTNADAGTDSAFWNNTEPTTSVISLGTEGRVNGNSQNYVAYAWHNVAGMQRFGTYIGNGKANGSTIFLGFRPRLFVTKKLGTDNWIVIDSGRETFNAVGEKVLLWDTNDTEFDPSNVNLDFVSNGVKMRNTDGKINASGTEYVYMAWGDVPFKYNNTF